VQKKVKMMVSRSNTSISGIVSQGSGGGVKRMRSIVASNKLVIFACLLDLISYISSA
jgi:hypothetical protein